MRIKGKIKVSRRTKALIPRLEKGDIVLLAHENIDDLAAQDLIRKKVKAVLNTEKSITGDFVVHGAEALLKKGIVVVDQVPAEWLDSVCDGQEVVIEDHQIACNGLSFSAPQFLDQQEVERQLARARTEALRKLESFVENTLYYLKKEKEWLFPDLSALPELLGMEGKEVVIVVRGKDYKEDLKALSFFIRERKPVLIGVDGGADALWEARMIPHVIIGDMDSVSCEVLKKAKVIIAQAYPDGRCPAQARLEKERLKPHLTIPFAGTSEDLALTVAYTAGATRIVGVGMHFSMDEFFQKGRAGMASTFLARLRAGSILFDAKGISEIYRPTVSAMTYFLLFFSILFVSFVVLLNSPYFFPFLRLWRLYLKQLGEF